MNTKHVDSYGIPITSGDWVEVTYPETPGMPSWGRIHQVMRIGVKSEIFPDVPHPYSIYDRLCIQYKNDEHISYDYLNCHDIASAIHRKMSEDEIFEHLLKT